MRHNQEHLQVHTLQDILSLLNPGDRCFICVPTTEQPIIPSVHAGAAVIKNAITVLPFQIHTKKRSQTSAKIISLEGTLSPTGALKLLRTKLKRTPKKSVILVDCTEHSRSWWKSGKERSFFIDQAMRMTQKSGFRTVWIGSRHAMQVSDVARIKDEVEFFLDIDRIGTLFFGQFLVARGVYASEFFLPRLLTVGKTGLELQHTLLPVREVPQDVSSDASPAPVIKDLLEQKYREIVEAARDGIIVFEVRGRHREFNKRAGEILGFSREELGSLRLADLVPPEMYRSTLRNLVRLRNSGSVSCDLLFFKKNRKKIVVNLSASKLKQGLYVGVFRDYTEYANSFAQVRESEDKLRTLLHRIPIPASVFVNRKLAYGNEAFAKLFSWVETGSHMSEIFGKRNTTFIRELAGLQSPEIGKEEQRWKVSIDTPSGDEMNLEVLGSRGSYNGKEAVECAFINTTNQEKAIREIEGLRVKYEQLFQKSPSAIAIVRDERLSFVNESFRATFGYTASDHLSGEDVGTILGSRLKKRLFEKENLTGIRPGEAITIEFDFERRDGKRISLDGQVTKVLNGSDHELVFYLRNSTEANHLREEMAGKLKALEILQDVAKAVSGSVRQTDQASTGLSVSLKGLGFESGAIYGVEQDGASLTILASQGLSEKALTTLSLQTMNEGLMGYVSKTQEPLLTMLSEYPAHLPYRSLFESEKFQIVAVIPLLSKGSVLGMMLVATARRKTFDLFQRNFLISVGEKIGEAMEQTLLMAQIRDSEMRYRSAVENIPDVVYHAGPEGGLTYLSPRIEDLLGYSAQMFYETKDLWRTILHPDDRAQYSLRISNQAETIHAFHLDYRMLPKGKAAYKWIRDSIRYSRGNDGRVISMTGMLRDITEQVELEESLRGSQGRKTPLVESIQDGVAIYDAEFRYIECNRAMEAITGISCDEMLGRHSSEVTPELVTSETRNLLQRALAGESVSTEDLPYTLPGQRKTGFLWARYTPLRNEAGTIDGVVGMFSDVTSRKALENEVRESEETLRNVIDAMGDALMISDLQGRVWEVNREFSRLTELSRSEALGIQFPYPWVVDEETAKYVRWIAALREANDLRDFDMTWQTKAGRRITVSLNTTLLRNAIGEPVAMLNIARDISDRMRLSHELEGKNRQIELLNRIIGKANTTIEFEEIFKTIASEVLELIPYDQVNVGVVSEDGNSLILYACSSPTGKNLLVGNELPLERTVSQLAMKQKSAVVIGDLSAHTELGPHVGSIIEGHRSQISIPIFLNEKVLGTFNIASVAANAFTGEELSFLQPIADQIGAMIDRVRLFQKVTDDSRYIHNLLNSIENVVFTVDREHRITAVNKAWREFAARQGLNQYLQETSIVGRNLEDIIQSEALWDMYRNVIPRLFEGSLEYYSHEFDLGQNSDARTYHMVMSPMLVDNAVTGLVFTYTDITSIKQTEEEIRKRNRELVAVNAMAAAINQSLNLEQVLSVASQHIKDLLGADMILAYLQDIHRAQVHLSHSLGLESDHAKRVSNLTTAPGVISSVLTYGKPMFIDKDVALDDRIIADRRQVFSDAGVKSLGVIPLRSKDEVLGALDVAFKTDHQFSSQEQQLLLLIGNQLGAAVENAQLYAEVRAQVQRVTSLYELGKGLTGALDTQSLLQIVHQGVSTSIPVDQFLYYAVSESNSSLTLVYEAGSSSAPSLKNDLLSSPESFSSVIENVATKGEAIIVDESVWGSQKKSLIAVPMRSKARVAGVLAIARDEPNAFTSSHLRILESIANLTEIAIDRARLYEDIVNKSVEIENRNKELDDFTYVVSHDLKEPLISIEGYSKILLQDYKDRIDTDGRDYLATTVQSASRMKHLIDDLLTLSRVGRVSEIPDNISASDTVRDVLAELQFTLREKNCTLNVSAGMPSVRYNPTHLSMVFRNLISNAIKFNDKPDPRIDIGVQEEEGQYLFSVRDNGIGIDKQYFEKVFVIFQRLQRSEEYRGTGAGLTIVKKIIEIHRGRIWVESELGVGTTFFFTIPKP